MSNLSLIDRKPVTLSAAPVQPARRRLVIGVASAGVLLSAADTYVIVLALPAIMADVGISIDKLQEATPIISGYLLGYVVLMPLLGRLSDVYGRLRVFLVCLGLFAAGSLVTASAHDLGSAVAGRALQGLGGGGLVPVTLALVADLWPVASRGVPLGVVGGVQELGSVVGPLYGALVLSLSTWRTIFWLNLPLCACFAVMGGALLRTPQHNVDRRREAVAMAAAVLCAACAGLALAAPDALVGSDLLGNLYLPLLGLSWLTPLTVAAFAFGCASLGAALRARNERAALRAVRLLTSVDWMGAILVALCLGCIVIAFSSSNPSQSAISTSAVWLLPLGLCAAAAFTLRQLRTQRPLIDVRRMTSPGAYGSLLTNLATGAALMAALLDVPILARSTVFPDSQLDAALVLLRLLIGVPLGALAGGWLSQRLGNRAVAAAGLLVCAAMLALMSRWSATTLADPFGPSWMHPSDPVLFCCGAGFGLAIAPVNASMLSAVDASLHGVASALVVVARMIGMLAGVSVLTAIGLHAFYTTAATFPSPVTLCPHNPLDCGPYNALVTDAVVTELRTVFLGAAIAAAIAALLAVLLLRSAPRHAPVAAHA